MNRRGFLGSLAATVATAAAGKADKPFAAETSTEKTVPEIDREFIGSTTTCNDKTYVYMDMSANCNWRGFEKAERMGPGWYEIPKEWTHKES